MRFIEIEPGLRLRFPGQSVDFCLGIEIGLIAGMLGAGVSEFTREISSANLEQVRILAAEMGYRAITGEVAEDAVTVTLSCGSRRPHLRVVGS